MIHVIPYHIGRGSWYPWYDIIYFDNQNVSFFEDENLELIENKKIGEPPYYDILLKQISKINIKSGDSLFFDSKYINVNLSPNELLDVTKNISDKFGCKLFLVDDDNKNSFIDTDYLTYFSNVFNIENSNFNFNYFRYRSSKYKWIHNVEFIINPFLRNIKQKKINFIVGVDKLERLLSLKHIYDIGLNKDAYIGYSAYSKTYNDSELSDDVVNFRDNNLPIISDIPYEKSLVGNVNVEYPPLPLTLNSYVSCICETSILCDNDVHLSEKSFNPFISMNIPLILGSKHITTYLKNNGYWMANDLFDLTPKNTIEEILNQFKSNLNIINNMSYSDLYDYYISNIGNMQKNYYKIVNEKFIFDRNNYK